MFAYCLNNPINLVDPIGLFSLDVDVSGLTLVDFEGTGLYYRLHVKPNGTVYEYWYNASGDLVHIRHHTDHGHPKHHSNPHDHNGDRDKNGHNTESKQSLPVDERFHGPEQFSNISQISPWSNNERVADDMCRAVTGTVLLFAGYEIFKWGLGALLAAPTGGGSIAVAAAMP